MNLGMLFYYSNKALGRLAQPNGRDLIATNKIGQDKNKLIKVTILTIDEMNVVPCPMLTKNTSMLSFEANQITSIMS